MNDPIEVAPKLKLSIPVTDDLGGWAGVMLLGRTRTLEVSINGVAQERYFDHTLAPDDVLTLDGGAEGGTLLALSAEAPSVPPPITTLENGVAVDAELPAASESGQELMTFPVNFEGFPQNAEITVTVAGLSSGSDVRLAVGGGAPTSLSGDPATTTFSSGDNMLFNLSNYGAALEVVLVTASWDGDGTGGGPTPEPTEPESGARAFALGNTEDITVPAAEGSTPGWVDLTFTVEAHDRQDGKNLRMRLSGADDTGLSWSLRYKEDGNDFIEFADMDFGETEWHNFRGYKAGTLALRLINKSAEAKTVTTSIEVFDAYVPRDIVIGEETYLQMPPPPEKGRSENMLMFEVAEPTTLSLYTYGASENTSVGVYHADPNNPSQRDPNNPEAIEGALREVTEVGQETYIQLLELDAGPYVIRGTTGRASGGSVRVLLERGDTTPQPVELPYETRTASVTLPAGKVQRVRWRLGNDETPTPTTLKITGTASDDVAWALYDVGLYFGKRIFATDPALDSAAAFDGAVEQTYELVDKRAYFVEFDNSGSTDITVEVSVTK